MRRAFVSACTAAVIATFTTAGCTTSTDEQSGSAQPQRATAAESTWGQGRELTAAEEILVRRAEQLLIKECMADRGFPYRIGALPTVDDLKGNGAFLTDVGWAQRNGYGSRLHTRTQHIDDPNGAYAKALPRKEGIRYTDALLGSPSSAMLTAELPTGGTVRTPRDSCLADARGRLYGDFETWFRAEKTATNLTPLYAADLAEDRRFTDAVKQWSACMRTAGHDYATPTKAREGLPELKKGLSEEKAYAVEVRLAVAEATCAGRTPLTRTTRALEAEYREKLPSRYDDALAAHQRMSLDALARAEKITGSAA
ncbi:hypothetical protein [Streptomyces albicerus]|jgi:hypothetical protein|uniref:hypothetical protein n=1 Tax=Streptomyces albicerus TaxID=2569859 RepID=UPI00124B57B5|nr:hypothetical protein [Streptomyces albicerus]